MLIVTNRNINLSNFKDGVGDAGAFGDTVNAKGPNEIRLAHAEKVNGNWEVRLVEEPETLLEDNLPSRTEFNALRKSLAEKNRNCLFFVHGFNQSFDKNLEKSFLVQKMHDVAVVAFSWPSNPGGFVLDEYWHAKQTARASVGALDSALEKFGRYITTPFDEDSLAGCRVRISLITFSLGNFLLQNYVAGALYDTGARLFENVVLCQADVDSGGHGEWVDRINLGKRLYVTINEDDKILGWAERASGRDRLGRTARNLTSKRAVYFDFTDGQNIGDKHGLFYEETNPSVVGFFRTVLNGGRGEAVSGFEYDERRNCYRPAPSPIQGARQTP